MRGVLKEKKSVVLKRKVRKNFLMVRRKAEYAENASGNETIVDQLIFYYPDNLRCVFISMTPSTFNKVDYLMVSELYHVISESEPRKVSRITIDSNGNIDRQNFLPERKIINSKAHSSFFENIEKVMKKNEETMKSGSSNS